MMSKEKGTSIKVGSHMLKKVPIGDLAELQKRADRADQSVLNFFQTAHCSFLDERTPDYKYQGCIIRLFESYCFRPDKKGQIGWLEKA